MTTSNVHEAVRAVAASVTTTVTGTVHPVGEVFVLQLNVEPDAGVASGGDGFTAPSTCV